MQIHVHRFVLNCIDMPRCYLMQIPGYIKIYYFNRKYMACGMTSFQCCKKNCQMLIFLFAQMCAVHFCFQKLFCRSMCFVYLKHYFSLQIKLFLPFSKHCVQMDVFFITYFIRFIILVTSTGNCAFHTSFSFQEIYQSHKNIIQWQELVKIQKRNEPALTY